MTETHIGVSLHPIASRLANQAPTPHIGPDLDAYRSVYAQSVGSASDAWWADVRSNHQKLITTLSHNLSRLPASPSTGTVLLLPSGLALFLMAISSGFPRVVSMLPTTVLTAGHSETPLRSLLALLYRSLLTQPIDCHYLRGR